MSEGTVRLDKWLWASRFYKTRAAAVQAIRAGRVDVNDVRAKPAKTLSLGDRVRIRKSPYEFRLTVRALSQQRGKAAQAALLYEEDPAGKAARERLAHQLRIAPTPSFDGKGRPTKRDRREMERLRGDEESDLGD
ncbi:MAG TPA: RNA-binding S4 domain-containing protein [Gemmatimonadales bacterium]|nr:RNA-binding S4 domain-containing protein [Gemmatimonadales bacterium]